MRKKGAALPNTCTVTNFGDKKSRQLIRKVKRQNENAIVAVVGCYAQTAPEELMNVDGVNLVIGTKDRTRIVELVEQYDAEAGAQSYVTDIMKERLFEPLSIQKLADRTRAYLKIQDGCSQSPKKQKHAAENAAIRYPVPDAFPIVETAVNRSIERLWPSLKAKVLAA